MRTNADYETEWARAWWGWKVDFDLLIAPRYTTVQRWWYFRPRRRDPSWVTDSDRQLMRELQRR